MRETILLVTMWIVTICTYISYVPQIVKIIKTKSSEDLSIASWVLWFISSTCDTVYSIVLSRPELIIASLSEFILIMITLILSFVYKNRKTITLDEHLMETLVSNCISEEVLLNIINNGIIPKETKEIAKDRISDIKYIDMIDISHISGN